MKIYRREEFLKLPEGTVFCKGKPWIFQNLEVKGESLANDFFSRTLQWVDAHDSGEAFGRLDEMLEKGASYPMESAEARDGCFNRDELFLVYEKADLIEMLSVFNEALRVAQ